MKTYRKTVEIVWYEGKEVPKEDCNIIGYLEDGSFFSAFYIADSDSLIFDTQDSSIPWKYAHIECYCGIDEILSGRLHFFLNNQTS